MREEELINLTRKIQQRKTEFQNVELKAAEVDFPKRIYDTLSAFSNQDLGALSFLQKRLDYMRSIPVMA